MIETLIPIFFVCYKNQSFKTKSKYPPRFEIRLKMAKYVHLNLGPPLFSTGYCHQRFFEILKKRLYVIDNISMILIYINYRFFYLPICPRNYTSYSEK